MVDRDQKKEIHLIIITNQNKPGHVWWILAVRPNLRENWVSFCSDTLVAYSSQCSRTVNHCVWTHETGAIMGKAANSEHQYWRLVNLNTLHLLSLIFMVGLQPDSLFVSLHYAGLHDQITMCKLCGGRPWALYSLLSEGTSFMIHMMRFHVLFLGLGIIWYVLFCKQAAKLPGSLIFRFKILHFQGPPVL